MAVKLDVFLVKCSRFFLRWSLSWKIKASNADFYSYEELFSRRCPMWPQIDARTAVLGWLMYVLHVLRYF